MKYTIAIPTYNNAETINNAIDSALNQKTSLEYEVLIVNNYSSDNTIDKIKSYDDKRLRLVSNLKTVDQFENHNICLREAKGDYVLFCHSDDTLNSNAISVTDQILNSYNYPEKIVTWGRSLFRDFYVGFKNAYNPINNMISGIYALKMFENGGLTPSGTCYSKLTFLEQGGFLPMRSKTTPSDMSSMLLFALHGAEFLMHDRIIFKREFASTATNLTKKDEFETIIDALKELDKKINDIEKQRLKEVALNIGDINLSYIIALKKAGFPITKKELRTSKIKWLTKENKNILKLVGQPFTRELFFS